MKLAIVVLHSPDGAPGLSPLDGFARGTVWVAGWPAALGDTDPFAHPSEKGLRLVNACIVVGHSFPESDAVPYIPCLVELLQDLDARQRFIAGLGEGIGVLGQAGLLVGRESVWQGVAPFARVLEGYGARIVAGNYAVRGRIHSGWGGEGLSAIAAALKIFGM